MPQLPSHSRPHPFTLPPEDRDRSPYTGWTRAHWEAAADGLLCATAPYASPRHGLISLPGPRPSFSGPRSDGLEGFARTFLLAAFRLAGDDGRDPHGLLDRYAQGLTSGTESPTFDTELAPGQPDSWPRIETVRQAYVEAASVALGLRLTRRRLWDTLDDRVRARIAEWLLPTLEPPPIDNNWWLFGLTVGGFLLDAGIETERAQAAIDRALARIDDWYRGDGWYSDGDNRAFDHYNAWALHFYPVLHAHLSGDAALLATHGARLHAQLTSYTRLFDTNGAPIPFGRSLTYRFAATAAPWLGALTGHTPLTPGATRRLASGALRHFLDRGAVTEDGLLPLGWYGPYAPMLQGYSGPASPYWASKGFLGLLLPADHPAWTGPEEPLPAETADAVFPLGPTGLLVQSTASDGLVRLHNHGSNSVLAAADPYYARYAYSTRTGPTGFTGLAGPTAPGFLAGATAPAGPTGPMVPKGLADGSASVGLAGGSAPDGLAGDTAFTPANGSAPNGLVGDSASAALAGGSASDGLAGDLAPAGPAGPMVLKGLADGSASDGLAGDTASTPATGSAPNGLTGDSASAVPAGDSASAVPAGDSASDVLAGDSTSDNHFALLIDGSPTTRGPATPHGTGPDWAASTHTPRHADGTELPGVRILSATLVHGRAELRAHLVTGATPGTPVRQTGWATTPDGPTAQLHPVHGYSGPPRETATGSTPFGPHTRTATLDGTVSAPQGALFISLASLTADPTPAPLHTLATTRITPYAIHVTWHDGTTSHLPFPHHSPVSPPPPTHGR
uniref:DUF2264 domain-containing protein n=1 Tax=Streptomyces sp. SID7805 TaxID=2690328 RepID=UPI000AD317DC|nr:DUF2264 domain-containing protein [Streptomyces sp. SID7805]